MKLVEIKCPNCGGTMRVDVEKEIAVCKYCHSEFFIQDNHKPSKRVITIDTEQLSNELDKKNKHYTDKILSIIFIAMIIVVGMMLYLLFSKDEGKDSIPVETVTPIYETVTPIYETETPSDEIETYVPSEDMKMIQSLIFRKSVSDITDEDLGKVKYISISYDIFTDIHTIYYSFEDYYEAKDKEKYMDELQKVEVQENVSSFEMSSEELQCFPNLTYVQLNHVSVELIKHLHNIKGIRGSGIEIDELLEVVDPANIIELSIDDTKSISKLNKFVNLQALNLYVSNIESIEPITHFDNISILRIEDYGGTLDYSEINKLRNLQELYLNLGKVKDVSFIKDLTNLKKLTIKGTIIKDIDWIAANKKLENLTLDLDGNIKDFSIIGTLSNLRTLDLSIEKVDVDLSWIAQLKNLERMHMFGAYGQVSFNFFKSLSKLRKLEMSYCNIKDLSCLSRCYALEYFKINNANETGCNFGQLAGLPKLKELDISDNRCWGEDLSSICNIASLEKLNLDRTTFELDFDKLAKLKNLKELSLNDVTAVKNIYVDSYDWCVSTYYDDIDFEEEVNKLAGCKSLEVLRLDKDKISDLNFIKGLPNLREIYFLDNYVSDISCLADCQKLEYVFCRSNSIVDWSPLIGKQFYR